MTSLIMAGIAIGTSATAGVTLATTNGKPLPNQIFGIAGSGNTDFASAPKNNNVVGVTYTGNAGSTMGITSGFAQINDKFPKSPTWFDLIINPLLDFTNMKFAVQLTGSGNVSVYYLLSSSHLDANNAANYTQLAGTFSSNKKSNVNYLIAGGTFDGILIRSTSPKNFLFEVKQNSFSPAGPVPEPATWAMMLMGFGLVGFGLRNRRKQSVRVTYA